MVVCQPAAEWFPTSYPGGRAPRVQLARTYRASCPAREQVEEDASGRGPVRAPVAVSLHDRGELLYQVGGVVVRPARRNDVQAVSTNAVIGERKLERFFLQTSRGAFIST